jgi:Bacterial shufflon protein, N-terminal constant region
MDQHQQQHHSKSTESPWLIVTLHAKAMQLIIQPLQQGFTLLEGLLGLSVLMGLLALGSHHTQGRLEEQLCQSAATHLRVVADAAERYVLDNYGQSGAEAEQQQWQHKQQQTPEAERQSLETWRFQQLRDKQYLPEGFEPNNLYGQHYAIRVKRQLTPIPCKQLLVLTSKGRNIEELALRRIARQLGGRGGYLSSQEKNEHDEYFITGNQRGWKLTLTPETSYQSPDSPEEAQLPPIYPAPGHLASLSLLYDDELLRGTTLLHRTAIPDQPELNQMETDLVMQQHQIIFENGPHSGTLDAQKLELMTQQPGYEHSSEALKLTMTPEKITFTGERPPERWRHQVTSYSASELHRYWNKVPYYELRQGMSHSAIEEFADGICAEGMDNHSGKFPTTGRLFMVGFEGAPKSQLYLCGHAPTSSSTGSLLAGPKAQQLHAINHSRLQDIKDNSKTALNALIEKLEKARDYGAGFDDEMFNNMLDEAKKVTVDTPK